MMVKPKIKWSCEWAGDSIIIFVDAGYVGSMHSTIPNPENDMSMTDWYILVAYLTASLLHTYYTAERDL
tara:strand:+ start:33117 stop:33323 length:207 start_codon:yes stop_codon:yes gene_type:complete